MTSDYAGQDLRGCVFSGHRLEGANFRAADLEDSRFVGADLRRADFTGADLTDAVFAEILPNVLIPSSGTVKARLSSLLLAVLTILATALSAAALVPSTIIAVQKGGVYWLPWLVGVGMMATLAALARKQLGRALWIWGLAVVAAVCGTYLTDSLEASPGGSWIIVAPGLVVGAGSLEISRAFLQSRSMKQRIFLALVNALSALLGSMVAFTAFTLLMAIAGGGLGSNMWRFSSWHVLLATSVPLALLHSYVLLVDREDDSTRRESDQPQQPQQPRETVRRANLFKSTFSGAKLRRAYLPGVNLCGASFVGADLTGSTLTGACLDGWLIDESTILDDVVCGHFYLDAGARRVPADPSRSIAPGQFGQVARSISQE